MPQITPQECTVPGCDRQVVARALCGAHYRRWRLYGTTELADRGNAVGIPEPRTYKSAHSRMNRVLGPARHHKCCDCGAPAREWSYNYNCDDEQQSEYGPWCTHPKHYSPRCIPCHARQSETRWGTGHHNAVLNPELARSILTLHNEGHTQVELAAIFNVSRSTIGKVVRRETWKHVE